MDIIIVNNQVKNFVEGKNIYYTKSADDVKLLVNDNVKTVISVGGDGTLNSCVSSFINKNVKYSVFPKGTGNDFARCISNKRTFVDVWNVNEHIFTNIVSFGIDAQVANNVSKFKKKFIPKSLAYLFSIIYTIFKLEYANLVVNINNQVITGNFSTVILANGQYYGNGIRISPNSIISDQLLDIILVDKIPRLKLIMLLLSVKSGKHLNSKHVKVYHSNIVKIESKSNIMCNFDGEIMQNTLFEISFIKQVEINRIGEYESKL